MKNSLKFTGFVLCGIALLLIGGSIGFFVGNNQVKCKKDNKEEQENSVKYKVSLEAPEDFSIATDTYDEGKHVNLTLTSAKKYSYIFVEVKAYYSTGEIFVESSYNFNLIGEKDELLMNLPITKDGVDTIVVSVTTAEYDENILTYNKKMLDFSIKKSEKQLEFSSENKLFSDLRVVNGYVLFYKEDRLVDTLPFSIENISKDDNIATSITNTTKKYDKAIIHINETY